MSWKQVLTPNLDTDPNHPLYIYIGGSILTDWYGWCLAVVAGSFGAKGSSYSAKTAWQACSTKHLDRNLPEGVYLPLWYEGGEYGHVVIGRREGNNLTIWTSPYTHIATFQTFRGEMNWLLDYIGQVFAVGKFSGWSETVLDSRVIELETPKPEPPKPEVEVEEKLEFEEVKDESEPEPEPDPAPEDEDLSIEKEEIMTQPEPAKSLDQQLIGGIIEEASQWFDFSKTVKLIAYLVGDGLLIGAILVPDIINIIQAENLSIFGEYLAKLLFEAGVAILLVFKLIKKK